MVFLWTPELETTTTTHLLAMEVTAYPKIQSNLLASYDSIPQELIKATVISNKKRKFFLTHHLKKHSAKRIGVYKLAMKQGSDNWRESAVLEIIKKLKISKKEFLIYEPHFDKKTFMGIKVIQ